MNFWLRNLVIGLILIVLALAMYLYRDVLFSMGGDWSEENVAQELTENINREKDKLGEEETVTTDTEKRTNAAAEGLSRFYANLHGEADGDGPRIRNNVVYLPDPEGDLIRYLEDKKLTTRAYSRRWRGTKDTRPFRVGNTLYQKLSEYTESDGLELIWWLNKDFLVKDPFRINKDILDTTRQIGLATNGHFQNGTSSFFCYKQRSVVIIENNPGLSVDDYLRSDCIELKPTPY